MTYPSPTDYVAAIQDPRALVDPGLRRARLSVDPVLQIPIPASGNSAVVFKAAIDGRAHALRFFIREDASTQERYRSLRAFLVQRGLADCTAATEWVGDAVEIRQQRWPMVRMEWVEGRTLDVYIDYLVDTAAVEALAALAQAWRELVARMQAAGFAHGDLQHGNVLVDTRGRLQLVDFDGSWFEGVTGSPPTETGHPNYQLRSRPWGRWMDTFPGLLVYTALRGLAVQPSLWTEFSDRENILFAKDDFLPPFDTEIWPALLAIGDPVVTHCASQLRATCAITSGLTVPLESVLTEQLAHVPDLEERRTRPEVGRPPLPADAPWWARTEPPTIGPGGAGAPAAITLPTPPPKTASFEPPTDSRFAAGQPPPTWFAPEPASSVPTGAGPARPPGRPSSRRQRGRRGLWASVLVLLLLGVLVIGRIAVTAWSDGSGTTSGSSEDPSGTSYSPSPEVSPTLETTVDGLLEHVPEAIRPTCEPYKRPAGVNIAVRCRTHEVITLRYYLYRSVSAMDAAFNQDYRTSHGTGSCADNEEGTENYSRDGAKAGRFSCYVSNQNPQYRIVSRTHEETGILTLALHPTAPFPELMQASEDAGPY